MKTYVIAAVGTTALGLYWLIPLRYLHRSATGAARRLSTRRHEQTPLHAIYWGEGVKISTAYAHPTAR